MPRLIDADALTFEDDYYGWRDKKVIKAATTIDAVPVVRCGDCRWYDPRTKNCLDGLYGVFEPDWFCKDGQRREDGDA